MLNHQKVGKPQGSISRDQQTLKLIQERGTANVDKLFVAFSGLDPTITKQEMTEIVWRLAADDKIELEDLPLPSTSFYAYIKFWDRNLWFYLSAGFSLATMIMIYAMPLGLPFIAVRWFIGMVFVLFIPGYVLVQGLFVESVFDSVERLILSVGLSITLVMLVGLFLNFTPFGIRLTPVVVSLTLLTSGIALITLTRQYARDTRRRVLTTA